MREMWADNSKLKIINRILIVGTVLAAIKCIFVGIQVDEEYAFSMANRLLLGDKLFAQIWDPHQTSAFLIAFLMGIYQWLFHTNVGVVIWARFWATIIHAGAAIGVNRMVSRRLDKRFGFYFGLLYFNLLPKGYATPEFSNMLVWSVTFLLLSVSWWEQKKGIFPAVVTGLCMCLTVLSYPSAVILFPFIIWYLWRKKEGRKAALTVGVVCLVCGGAYLGYLFSYMTPPEFVVNIQDLLEGNSGHAWNGKWKKHLLELASALVLMGIYAAVVGAALWIADKVRGKRGLTQFTSLDKNEKRFVFFVLVLAVGVLHMVIHWILMLHIVEHGYIYSIYGCLLAGAWVTARKYPELKDMATLWLGGCFCMLLSVILLTDLNIYTTIRYAIPGMVVSLVILLYDSMRREEKGSVVSKRLMCILLLFWCLAATFIKGWEYPDIYGRMRNITWVRSIMSEGPATGLFTQYMQSYTEESLYAEMQQYVEPGDKLFFLSMGTIAYMYQDVEVSSYTTICDPRYNEILLKYWEKYPEKYPDVIIVPCWFGALQWDAESWIMQWIDNEFEVEQVIDGTYFRYYISDRDK